MDAPDGDRFVLRIHRPGLRTINVVRSEMAWLAALRRDTDLVVPEPVPTRDGNTYTVTQVTGVPEPRICVLFRWIKGRFLNNSTLTPTHFERVGEFMALLQLHASRFMRSDFVRGRVDNLTDAARRATPPYSSAMAASQRSDLLPGQTDAVRLVTDACSSFDGELVARIIRRVREAQIALGQDAEAFGLIHADLHHENYFFHQGQIRAIDFDDCGYGHYLYDMGVTLRDVAWREDFADLRLALLKGYRNNRPLPGEHEQFIDTFIALRDLQMLVVGIEMYHDPCGADGVQEALRALREFVES